MTPDAPDRQQLFTDELTLMLRVPYPIIAIRGTEERYLCATLARLAKALKRQLWCWSPSADLHRAPTPTNAPPAAPKNLSETPSFALLLRAMNQIEAHTTPAIFILLDPDEALEDARTERRLRTLLFLTSQRQQTIVLLSADAKLPPSLQHHGAHLDAPLPSRNTLRTILDRVMPADRFQLIPRERIVAAALGLTREEAHRAFTRTRLTHAKAGAPLAYPWDLEILREKRRIISRDDVVEFVESPQGLEKVGGLDDLKLWLQTRKAAFGAEARAFGLPAPRGLLLVGVQGCGKSLVGKAVAHHWGLPLLRLDLGRVFSNRRPPDAALRHALSVAESLAPCILWVDEIEKAFGAQADSNVTRILGTLLTWLQEKHSEVFFVATANEVHQLPPELLRKGRFDEMFFLDLPDALARRQILSIHLKKQRRDPNHFDLETLSEKSENFSGAELEQLIIAGLYEAFAEGRDLEQTDLLEVASKFIPLYATRQDAIKKLREWASSRARFAAHDRRLLDYFTTS